MSTFMRMIMIPSPISHTILSLLTSVDVARLMCAINCKPGSYYAKMYMNPFLDLFEDVDQVKRMMASGFSFTFLGRDLRRFITRVTSPQSYIDIHTSVDTLEIYCVVTSPHSNGPGCLVYHRLLCANFDSSPFTGTSNSRVMNDGSIVSLCEGWMTCLDMSMCDFETFPLETTLVPGWELKKTRNDKATVLRVYNAGSGQYDSDGVSVDVFNLMRTVMDEKGRVIMPYITVRDLNSCVSPDMLRYSDKVVNKCPDKETYDEKFANSLMIVPMVEFGKYQRMLYENEIMILPGCLS